jgi:hypothetical protein
MSRGMMKVYASYSFGSKTGKCENELPVDSTVSRLLDAVCESAGLDRRRVCARFGGNDIQETDELSEFNTTPENGIFCVRKARSLPPEMLPLKSEDDNAHMDHLIGMEFAERDSAIALVFSKGDVQKAVNMIIDGRVPKFEVPVDQEIEYLKLLLFIAHTTAEMRVLISHDEIDYVVDDHNTLLTVSMKEFKKFLKFVG